MSGCSRAAGRRGKPFTLAQAGKRFFCQPRQAHGESHIHQMHSIGIECSIGNVIDELLRPFCQSLHPGPHLPAESGFDFSRISKSLPPAKCPREGIDEFDLSRNHFHQRHPKGAGCCSAETFATCWGYFVKVCTLTLISPHPQPPSRCEQPFCPMPKHGKTKLTTATLALVLALPL
jgi:hypothetical protein